MKVQTAKIWLTQKAMLKPTSILFMKPIAAVVWRWSLIFHTTSSSLFLAFVFLFSLSTLFLSPLTKITQKNDENKIFSTWKLFFPHNQNTMKLSWTLSMIFILSLSWMPEMNNNNICEPFKWKKNSELWHDTAMNRAFTLTACF